MSEIIFGSTYHKRNSPVSYGFSYPLYMLKLPLNKLEEIDKSNHFFGYNKRRLFSIYDKDYLQENNDSISQKALSTIRKIGKKIDLDNISLITVPRFFQKVFKPVSFYLAYDKAKNVVSMIAEVTNTYGETHLYTMAPETATTDKDGKAITRFNTQKNFHVSPFFKEDGHYEFKVVECIKNLAIHINYIKKDGSTFYANFCGRKRPLSALNSLRILLFWPFTAALTMPRILWQATKLYFFKKIPAFSKPPVSSADTIRSMPMTRFQTKVLDQLTSVCETLEHGQLTLQLANGEKRVFGKPNAEPKAEIHIQNNWFFRSIAMGGEIGFGESYVNNEWTTPDLAAVIDYMIRNQDQVESTFSASFFRHLIDKLLHFRHANTIKQSKKNISEHYDLGNDFYKLFLDKTMTYSAGIFNSPEELIEQAQERKVLQLIEPLQLTPSHHVLEIGSGWGFVAVTIAKKYGAKVSTITLSEEQHRYVSELIKAEKCDDLVTVKLQDYRKVVGQYDAIVSVEMIEAVGDAFLKTYFNVVNHALKPGGRFALQAITYPDHAYDTYKNDTDFIRKHIFPGGHLPSLAIIETLVKKQTQLKEVQRQNIADGYAITLKKWRQRFMDQTAELMKLGMSESFIRKWEYYFAYCEAAFSTDYLGTYQIIFEKEAQS